MPPVEPDKDVVAFLAANLGTVGGVAWTNAGAGANIFTGPVRPTASPSGSGLGVPAAAIFVLASGGPAPDPYLGSPASSSYAPRVQVRVRGNPGDNANALLVARTVRDKLHRAAISGYVSSLVQNAEPIYLAQDDAGSHEWSINFILLRAGTP
jgi:hypothetical protein